MVIVEMIDHFMDGSGSPYSNSELTAAVLEHESTKKYISCVQSKFNELMARYNASIIRLTYSVADRSKNPLVKAVDDIGQPEYSSTSDKINGLTICIDKLWGNKIEILAFNVSGTSYSGVMHFTLYDHFGLDQGDVEKFGMVQGFKSWYILQHYSEYAGKYRPFLTLIEFDVPFSGNLP